MTTETALEFLASLAGDAPTALSITVTYQWSEDAPPSTRTLGYPVGSELLAMLKAHPEIVAELSSRVAARFVTDLDADREEAEKKLVEAKRSFGVT